jgi:hypothetical protein
VDIPAALLIGVMVDGMVDDMVDAMVVEGPADPLYSPYPRDLVSRTPCT